MPLRRRGGGVCSGRGRPRRVCGCPRRWASGVARCSAPPSAAPCRGSGRSAARRSHPAQPSRPRAPPTAPRSAPCRSEPRPRAAAVRTRAGSRRDPGGSKRGGGALEGPLRSHGAPERSGRAGGSCEAWTALQRQRQDKLGGGRGGGPPGRRCWGAGWRVGVVRGPHAQLCSDVRALQPRCPPDTELQRVWGGVVNPLWDPTCSTAPGCAPLPPPPPPKHPHLQERSARRCVSSRG